MSLLFEVSTIETSAAVRVATERLLEACGVQKEAIKATTRFAVISESSGETFLGVRPIIASLAGLPNADPIVVGGTPADRVNVSQWVLTALQIAAGAIQLSEIDSMLPSKGQFLAGTPSATAADLYLYTVASATVAANPKVYPNLAQWIRTAEKSPLIATLKATASPTSPSAEGDGSGNASTTAGAEGGASEKAKSKQVRPSDEAIAAARAEKEAARLAKEAAKTATTAPGASAVSDEGGDAGKKTAKKGLSSAELDLRIGKIVHIEKHPDSDKLFVEKIDLGDKDGPRTIVSGLAAYYKPEQLLGVHCLVLCNLKPRALAGVTSAGMVLCASNDAGLSVVTADYSAPGSRVAVGAGVSIPSEYPAPPSGKQMEELLKHFNTDGKGQVRWQDQPLLVGGTQAIISTIPNAIVK